MMAGHGEGKALLFFRRQTHRRRRTINLLPYQPETWVTKDHKERVVRCNCSLLDKFFEITCSSFVLFPFAPCLSHTSSLVINLINTLVFYIH